jgi:Immunity protein 49
MVLYIPRHEHGWESDALRERLAAYANRRLPISLGYLTIKPDNLTSVLSKAISYAGYLSVLEPTSPELYRAFNIAAHATRCIFLLADLSIKEEYDLFVGEGDPFRFPQTGPTTYSDSPRWQNGFYLAAACRHKSILDSLLAAPTAIMRHPKSREGINEYSHLMVDALKSFYNPEVSIEEAGLQLRDMTDATAEDRIIPELIDGTINIALPAMELLTCLLDGNPDNFNESLADAIRCHKKFWSSDEQMAGDPRGFIALAPLGFACIAYDLGIPIEVESEYLPRYILTKQFLTDLSEERVIHYREPQRTQSTQPDELSVAITHIHELEDQFAQACTERYQLEEVKYTGKAHFTDAQQQALSAVIHQVIELSRQIGQRGAEIYIREQYPTAVPEYGVPDLGVRPGTIDFHQVWRRPGASQEGRDLYIVITAKGGGTALGSIQIGRLKYSEGTPQYFDEVVKQMSQNQDSPEAQRVGALLKVARQNGDLRYLEARTQILQGEQGSREVGDVVVQEYDISPANV